MKQFLQITTWNRILPFLFLLMFSACEKNINEAPVPVIDEEPSCLLTEETIESNTFETINSKLAYIGPNKQIVYLWAYQFDPNTDRFEPLRIESYTLITYDAHGNIVKAEATGDFEGDTKAMHVFEYNANNLLTKWTFYYQFEGKLEEYAIQTFEYASPTQLKKVTVSSPWFGNYESAYYLYEYKDGLMDKVSFYEKNPSTQKMQLYFTKRFQYDNKKHPKRKGYALHLPNNSQLYGYPFQHNIVKETSTFPNDPQEYVDYTSTYTYNDAGFPITQRKLQGGNLINYTYTYQCR